jgi:hypothetical protein
LINEDEFERKIQKTFEDKIRKRLVLPVYLKNWFHSSITKIRLGPNAAETFSACDFNF